MAEGVVSAAPHASPGHGRGASGLERVLIADDHPLVRDGLRTVIAVAFDGCELFEAASLEEALATIERERDFDLVLLDLHMPGSEGFSGLSVMREHYPSVPVVIVSAATERGLVDGALAAGAAGFIPKSMKRSEIMAALRTVAAGEVFIPADFAEANRPDPEEQDIARRIESLTPQQKVVLGLVAAGKLNKQIAYELDVSLTTVKAHMSAILSKLGVYSRTQAVILAGRTGFKGP